MGARRRAGMILVLVAAACSCVLAAEDPTSDPALLRQRLLNSVGVLPWNLAGGYSLEGRLILKTTGEEISYKARYGRSPVRWAADFSQENRSLNMRYVLSGKQAWITSPEVTADVTPSLLPYIARFDFPQLYEELLRILDRGNRDPSFVVNVDAGEIHVGGKLQNGWKATFVLNTVEYFPRKVLVTVIGEPSTAWLIPLTRPDGSYSLKKMPGPTSEFEIWLSDPMDAGACRYARRMDFVEHGNIVATFSLDRGSAAAAADDLFNRPPRFPWSGSIQFSPSADPRRASLFLGDSEIPAFRSRMEMSPWSGWARESGLIAFWAILVAWLGLLFPQSVSLRLIAAAVAIGFLGFLYLLVRRRRQFRFRRTFPWRLFFAGVFLGCLVLIAGVASYQLHRPRDRSLIALHSAIRYAVSGHSFYANRANSMLLDFAREAPAKSIGDLGHSCQAYAQAYDLIRPALQREQRMPIEKDLFDYARPLFGASRGWNSNMDGSSVLSAGLGMVGLAIGYEPYVIAASEVMDRMLATQLIGGWYRSGPGPGGVAMDSAVNLFYALKHAGRADYYSHAAVQQYVPTVLQVLSPVGTLPLFGDTDLEQSARLSAFLLKIANHLSSEDGRRCVAARNLYWERGRYRAEGWIKWILPLFQPMLEYWENPYLILQYTRALSPSPLLASSAVLGKGQSVVLRTGPGPDSAYLALNLQQSNPDAMRRDILTFDVYAYGCLLLHGAGFPGTSHPQYMEITKTTASNSITLNQESQSAGGFTEIESSLLNQPLFDHIRALADNTYDYGHVRRDIVMSRTEKNHPAYFFLLDDVFVSDPETSVQWHLHGRGELATGIDQTSRWTSAAFGSPKLRSNRIILEAAHPIGLLAKLSTKPGVLYSKHSYLNQRSESTLIEWTGSRRFCTILFPHRSGEAPLKIETLGKASCRVEGTDWISLGSLESRVTIGPLAHVSEYTILRERSDSFPALLMVSGSECRFDSHALFSSKPVTVSLNGLRGSLLNSRPDTRIEIHSPEIRAGDRFYLDGRRVTAAKPGLLAFTLVLAAEHSFRDSRDPGT